MNQLALLESLRRLSFVIPLSLVMAASLTACRKDNPGTWPADRVATKVAESLELTGVSLSPTDRGLEGTGQRADGETLTLIVTQNAQLGEIRWDAKGDRGFVEQGYFQLQ